jgi:hypothetical protein
VHENSHFQGKVKKHTESDMMIGTSRRESVISVLLIRYISFQLAYDLFELGVTTSQKHMSGGKSLQLSCAARVVAPRDDEDMRKLQRDFANLNPKSPFSPHYSLTFYYLNL